MPSTNRFVRKSSLRLCPFARATLSSLFIWNWERESTKKRVFQFQTKARETARAAKKWRWLWSDLVFFALLCAVALECLPLPSAPLPPLLTTMTLVSPLRSLSEIFTHVHLATYWSKSLSVANIFAVIGVYRTLIYSFPSYGQCFDSQNDFSGLKFFFLVLGNRSFD